MESRELTLWDCLNSIEMIKKFVEIKLGAVIDEKELESVREEVNSLIPKKHLLCTTKQNQEAIALLVLYRRRVLLRHEMFMLTGNSRLKQALIQRFDLQPSEFDVRGDQDSFSHDPRAKRGGRTYQKPLGWIAIGLAVAYPDGDQWIGKDGGSNEWAIGFHGTRNSRPEVAFPAIIKLRALCTQHIQCGIYFADNVEKCYFQSITLGDRNYCVCFQCRIHPSYISGSSNFFTVSSPVYIRPYRILLKPQS